MPESKTSPRRIAARARVADALTLRSAGASYEEIARKLSYADHSGARKAIERALRESIQEAVENHRKLQNLRLDRALRAIWPYVLQGSLSHIDRLVKILERQAKLNGLDAPVKTELTGKDGGPLQVTESELDLSVLSDEELALLKQLFTKAKATVAAQTLQVTAPSRGALSMS